MKTERSQYYNMMCIVNRFCRGGGKQQKKEREHEVMCRSRFGLSLALLGLLGMAANQNVVAHTCPDNATVTGVAVTLTAFHNDGVTPIGTGTVGECETIKLRMAVAYTPRDVQNNVVCEFQAGDMTISREGGAFVQNVTPAGGVPL